jgi:hypothetical protein
MKTLVEYKVREYYPNGELYTTIRTARFTSLHKAEKFAADLQEPVVGESTISNVRVIAPNTDIVWCHTCQQFHA